MRMVNKSQLDGGRKPRAQAADTGDLGQQLGDILAGVKKLDGIEKMCTGMNASIKEIEKRLNKLEAQANGLNQYRTEHTEFHRNQATMHGKREADVQKSLAGLIAIQEKSVKESVAAQTSVFRESMQAQIATLKETVAAVMSAIETFSNKKIEVNVAPPDQTVKVERENQPRYEFDIKRGRNGLIDKIEATPK